ncbi:MAG: porin, partial [Gemmatimonadaceae bacterium]
GPRSAQWSVGGGAYSSHDAAARLSSEFGFDADETTPARDNTLAGRRAGLGLDTQLRLGPVDVWGEYLRVRFEPRNAVPLGRFVSDGWYAQGSSFVVPDRLQLVVRYETFDPNRSTAGTATNTWLLGVNDYVRGNNLKLQLNYMRSDVEALPRIQHKVIARLQVMFST